MADDGVEHKQRQAAPEEDVPLPEVLELVSRSLRSLGCGDALDGAVDGLKEPSKGLQYKKGPTPFEAWKARHVTTPLKKIRRKACPKRREESTSRLRFLAADLRTFSHARKPQRRENLGDEVKAAKVRFEARVARLRDLEDREKTKECTFRPDTSYSKRRSDTYLKKGRRSDDILVTCDERRLFRARQKEKNDDEETTGLTFRPELNAKSKQLSILRRQRKKQEPPPPEMKVNTKKKPTEVYDRLYARGQDFLQRHHNSNAERLEASISGSFLKQWETTKRLQVPGQTKAPWIQDNNPPPPPPKSTPAFAVLDYGPHLDGLLAMLASSSSGFATDS